MTFAIDWALKTNYLSVYLSVFVGASMFVTSYILQYVCACVSIHVYTRKGNYLSVYLSVFVLLCLLRVISCNMYVHVLASMCTRVKADLKHMLFQP